MVTPKSIPPPSPALTKSSYRCLHRLHMVIFHVFIVLSNVGSIYLICIPSRSSREPVTYKVPGTIASKYDSTHPSWINGGHFCQLKDVVLCNEAVQVL